LDVIVFRDLVETFIPQHYPSRRVMSERLTNRFTEIDTFLSVPPSSRASQLPRITGKFRVTEVGESGFLIWIVESRFDGRVRRR
jgi:hypothetical protein